MPKTLIGIKNAFFDFLFPPNADALELERLADAGELSSLPPAKKIEGDIHALFDYSDERVRTLVWQIKYADNGKLISACGALLYEAIFEELADTSGMISFEKPLLIPVPLSKKRERERGFNQSLLLAKGITANDNEDAFELRDGIVAKTKNTVPQTSLSKKKDRLNNLSGCFEVPNQNDAEGRNIILIDDVTTTGATFSEIKGVLKEAGAKKIICFALAH